MPYTCLLISIGRTQFHDVRASAEILDTGRRQEPECREEVSRWCDIWSGRANMHLPFVGSHIHASDSHTDHLSDVLRRRFQINTMPGMGYQYKSIPHAVKVIVAQEGIKGFYKGIVPNLLKVAPSMASSWLTYEVTRDFFLSLKSPEEDFNITAMSAIESTRRL